MGFERPKPGDGIFTITRDAISGRLTAGCTGRDHGPADDFLPGQFQRPQRLTSQSLRR